jgi:hypothetical protein
MARAHEIGIAADARDFERGIRDGVINPVEEAADALDDLADAAADTGAATADTGADGSRGIERLEDALRDAQRQTDDLGDKAKRAGSDVRAGMRRAEDGVGEFRDEANSTAREAAASFDGSAESIGDAFQEVAANAFAGFGPAGAVAGIAAAAGIGLAKAGFDAVNESIEASKERTQEWADAFIEANGRVLEQTQIQTNVQSILSDETGKLARAQQIAKLTGQDLNDVVAGMADPFGAMGKVLSDEVNDALDNYRDKARSAAGETGTANAEAMAQTSLLTLLSQTWKAHTDEVGGGADAYDLYARAAGRAQTANLEAAVAAGEATKRVDKFGDAVYTLPDGKKVYVDAETGKATEDLDDIKRRIYSVPDATVKVRVDSSEWDWYQPQPKVARIIVRGGLGTGRREVWE